jgi:hypothetical protein
MKVQIAVAIGVAAISGGCKKAPPRNADVAPSEAPAPTTLPSAPKAAEGAVITYSVPAGWSEHPPMTRMRRAQFVLPGKAGPAELIVFHFPGTGGSAKDNLDRWYTQFKQPDGSPTAQKAETKKLTVNGLTVTTVYVSGTFLKPKSPMAMGGPTDEVPAQAMLAAVVETERGPWFFKAIGPKATIDAQRASFEAFVRSFQRKS